MVYDKEYATRNGNTTTAAPTANVQPNSVGNVSPISSPQAIPTTFTPTSTTSNSMADLTEQLSRLTLAMQVNMQGQLPVNVSNINTPALSPAPRIDRHKCV